jgi:hypothetical protein
MDMVPVTRELLNTSYDEGKPYLHTLPKKELVDLSVMYTTMGPSHAVIYKEKLICCGGIILSSTGVGSLWANVTTHVTSAPIFFVKQVCDFLNYVASEHHLRRIETLIDARYKENLKFASYFHFRKEGRLRRVNPDGTDSYIVAITFPD